jgi:DNA primase
MSSGDAVQQVKERLDIVEVISTYVELKPAGKSLKGKSPFTNERTPSFYVSPDRGMYYCFSTNQGGDIFTFIEKMEGVDFKGALKILADRAGVELVREDPKKRTERDNQYAAMESATVFYEQQLRSCDEAVAYLKQRGVTGLTAKQWRIGYAPDEWRELKTALEAKQVPTDILRTVALIKGEAGKEPYDVFRDRVMFPICDPSGRVIGFSGRLLHPDDKAPKYVNSPESPLFKKSEALFGYHRAKEGIRKMDFSLIVEGQFDVVLAHQAGYHNAVAVSGTALTPHHVALLSRLSNRCVLALDADRAGIAAVKKGAAIMLARGMDVKVARLPEGEDPADMIQANVAAFKSCIGKATHVIEFLLAVYRGDTKDDRTFKLQVREEVLPFVAAIPNHIDQEHFIGVVATALDVEKAAIRLELARLQEAATDQPNPEVIEVNAPPAEAPASTIKRIDSVYAYLQAAHPFLPVDMQAEVAQLFSKVTGVAITNTERLSDMVNQLSFTLEEQLASYTPVQLREEVFATLEELRQLTGRARLASLRMQLSNTEDETAILEAIERVKQSLVNDVIEASTVENQARTLAKN